uniref:Uncharacterized protein n=1 Tax=Anopheles atroparvus TaxID=41427 RepID=A0A182ITV4_ANOAO
MPVDCRPKGENSISFFGEEPSATTMVPSCGVVFRFNRKSLSDALSWIVMVPFSTVSRSSLVSVARPSGRYFGKPTASSSFRGLTPGACLWRASSSSAVFTGYTTCCSSSSNTSISSLQFFAMKHRTLSISSLLSDATSSSLMILLISSRTSSLCIFSMRSAEKRFDLGVPNSSSICLAWFRKEVRSCSSMIAALSAGSMLRSRPRSASPADRNGFVDSRTISGVWFCTMRCCDMLSDCNLNTFSDIFVYSSFNRFSAAQANFSSVSSRSMLVAILSTRAVSVKKEYKDIATRET